MRLAAALLLLGLPATALAHTRSQSFSTWQVKGADVRVTYSVAAREVTRLPPIEGPLTELDALLVSHARGRIGARAGDVPCEIAGEPRSLVSRKGFERLELHLRCPREDELWIRVAMFFPVAPGHVHFARVRVDGGLPVEHLLTVSRPEAPVSREVAAGDARPGATFAGYVRLGAGHIAGGLDHLAFLGALLLLLPRLRDMALMVTGFTAGHSLTLSLAVLGWVRPHAVLVEALIGYTIALVAIEYAGAVTGRTRALGDAACAAFAGLAVLAAIGITGPAASVLAGLALFTGCYLRLVATGERVARRARPAITALFGLVHGFGFAGMLLEIGVPDDRRLQALAGFNIGVELGQLAIVGSLLVLRELWLRRRGTHLPALAGDLVTAVLCALGVYWFVSRAYG